LLSEREHAAIVAPMASATATRRPLAVFSLCMPSPLIRSMSNFSGAGRTRRAGQDQRALASGRERVECVPATNAAVAPTLP